MCLADANLVNEAGGVILLSVLSQNLSGIIYRAFLFAVSWDR